MYIKEVIEHNTINVFNSALSWRILSNQKIYYERTYKNEKHTTWTYYTSHIYQVFYLVWVWLIFLFYLFIYLSIYLSIYLYTWALSRSSAPSLPGGSRRPWAIYLYIYLSIYLSIYIYTWALSRSSALSLPAGSLRPWAPDHKHSKPKENIYAGVN